MDLDDLDNVGTNFITLDQIMHMSSASGRSMSTGSGWESDSQAETEDQQEDREEQERREFIEALRRSREAEEAELEKAAKKEEAERKARDEFGRVYASEGDVLDEAEVEEKKKTALELLEEQKRGKVLRPVDHSTIEYLSFRKNLYIVPKALARLTEKEIEAKREELQVKVRGKQCPAPVDTWGQCGLSERILEAIEKLGFEAPFAVQKQAIPAIMAGRDVIAVAKVYAINIYFLYTV
jgi:ATP-dependent RNA helicase DDX46/PRP5